MNMEYEMAVEPMAELQKIGFDLSDGSRCWITVNGTLLDDEQRLNHLREIKSHIDIILNINEADVSDSFPEDREQIDVRDFVSNME